MPYTPFAQQVAEWYRQYLGREATQQELLSHVGNPGGLPAVLQLIQQAAKAPAPPPPPPPTPTQTPAAWNPSLQGFAADKFNDPAHQTTKYAFARLAAKYPATAAGYAQLMADPALAALGFRGDGKGNIIAIDGRNGQYGVQAGEKIDVMQGYGSGGTGWQWGAGWGETATPAAPTPTPAAPTPTLATMTTKPSTGAGSAPTFPTNPNLPPGQGQVFTNTTSQYGSTPLSTSMSTTLGKAGATGAMANQGSVQSSGVAPTAGASAANALPLKDLMATYARMSTPSGQSMLVPKSQQARYTALGGRYL